MDQQFLAAVGELCIVRSRLRVANAQLGDEYRGIQALHNAFATGHVAEGWLDAEKARLDRIAALRAEREELQRLEAALKQRTGGAY
jgi:hypothetical protein